MDKKPQVFSDITPDMIQDWKAKYGQEALSELAIPLGDEESESVARFVMRVPDRNTATAMSQIKDEVKATNMLLENTVCGGDMEYIDKYAYVWAEVVRHASSMVEAKGSTLKKL